MPGRSHGVCLDHEDCFCIVYISLSFGFWSTKALYNLYWHNPTIRNNEFVKLPILMNLGYTITPIIIIKPLKYIWQYWAVWLMNLCLVSPITTTNSVFWQLGYLGNHFLLHIIWWCRRQFWVPPNVLFDARPFLSMEWTDSAALFVIRTSSLTVYRVNFSIVLH